MSVLWRNLAQVPLGCRAVYVRLGRQAAASVVQVQQRATTGSAGDGAGKGGGSGGSIRSAGGGFGKMEVAHEEKYFREEQARQLAGLKIHEIKNEMKGYEKQIAECKENIANLKQSLKREPGNEELKINLKIHKSDLSKYESHLKDCQQQLKHIEAKQD
ncbi:ATPase inhibitor mai-2, mitochondrial-like [Physella acuta]|uniref:ATPase inhibitor mai-2, mitochondrial-like n=1 Tax=Physella acuta TaxID=109671 RepID=UPI0027DCF526|nr:ATPase inhibitor mai-2, mitochondrial-like [Physella acuta]XP_059142284.1 ATPase inhibitor mai-2, mitochondrial-like [Physella acuta]XP_059142285.1 ATPase inhibitor mai-2, mitochondrial-like [Physella acuta]XP_059142286.1 ATPase inhibitor mai-2, mitochondrial-like [Physella acuta]XP_059142287.1 ATPase inhibitor mai-2, mitochondrial-like [Physella acuta]XP_059142288.1 ATPase inhibitor mai-2, mitochondrial-like [Physella acuta]XP_059142289.1 ATPase inhibitor mai-2, mitochondrial-like [Physel